MDNDNLLQNDEHVDIYKYLRTFRRFWWLILISIAACVALGALFIHIKNPKYLTQASIILNDNNEDSSGALGEGLSALVSTFSLGGPGYKSTEDEIIRILSHDNLTELVTLMDLNKVYWSKDGIFSRKNIYYQNSPIIINTDAGVLDTISSPTRFDITVSDGGKQIKVKVRQQDNDVVLEGNYKSFPITLKTPLATFTAETTKYFNPAKELKFHAMLTNTNGCADEYYEDIDLSTPSKKSNIVTFGFEGSNGRMSRDLINNLITIYNTRGIEDQRMQAIAAVTFIDQRLADMFTDLEDAEGKIENFRKKNNLLDVDVQTEYMFTMRQSAESDLLEMETRVRVLDMLTDFLKNDQNKYALIPFTTNVPEDAIKEYNELAMQRVRLEANAKGNNAALANISAQIDAMRKNLITSLAKERESANITIAQIKGVTGSSDKMMKEVPALQRQLLSLFRDQKIKETIYAFLLQKREENAMKASRVVEAGKILESPHTFIEPSSPKKVVVFGIAVVFGIICGCFGAIILQNLLAKRAAGKNN